MNDPATRLISDVSFSDVLFSISFERGLPPLASENRLPKVETFLLIKSLPVRIVRHSSWMIYWCYNLLEKGKHLTQNPDTKALEEGFEEQEGVFGNCEVTGFVLQHSLEPAFCLQAAKGHCSTWWSQTSQKVAGEGSAHLICKMPLFFFQNDAYEKHTWSQIWSNWQTFLFGSLLMLNKHKI